MNKPPDQMKLLALCVFWPVRATQYAILAVGITVAVIAHVGWYYIVEAYRWSCETLGEEA